MALIDVTLLQKFTRVFVFVFAVVVVYGLLDKTKFFGENKGLNAIIAFFIGLMVSLSTSLVGLTSVIIPVFAVIFIIMSFVSAGFASLGDPNTPAEPASGEVKWIILLLVLLLVAGIMFKVYNKNTEIDADGNVKVLNTSDKNYDKDNNELDVNYDNGVFNHKMLGLIMVLILGFFTIRLLAGASPPKKKE